MSLPITTAIFSLVIGLGLVGLLGHAMQVPSIAPTLGTMLGLGVGIDYSLFVITRYRELLGRGPRHRGIDRPLGEPAPAARSSSPAAP